MRLKHVKIKNFRSIEEARIEFDPRCRILVGMNEAGKSNVLKALATLDDGYPISIRDRRETKDGKSQDSYVEFVYKIDNNDKEALSKILCQIIHGIKYRETTKIIDIISEKFDRIISVIIEPPTDTEERKKKIELKNFTDESYEYLLEKLQPTLGLLRKKKEIDETAIENINVPPGGREQIRVVQEALEKHLFVHENSFLPLPESFKDFLSVEVSDREFLTLVIDEFKNLLTIDSKIIFWDSSDDKRKIYDEIPLQEFIKSSQKYVFLMNMFKFYEKIKRQKEPSTSVIVEKIKNLNAQAKEDLLPLANYLDAVAEAITENFYRIWTNYKNDATRDKNHNKNKQEKGNKLGDEEEHRFKFMLLCNKGKFNFSIEEKRKHTISSRSDGFKKFVKFLLIISTEIEYQEITNTLFIVDEPEVSLHHSAARDFRNLLIKIAEEKDNYVLYGTHSISMIDQENFARHYIVKRENEITTVKDAKFTERETISNNKKNISIVEHEILYNRIGYSVYEELKRKNILFEGWSDKKLFNEYIKERKEIEFGVTHAWGVKTFKSITPIIELAGRDVLIVSDCDNEAKNQQKEYKKNAGYGEWFTYKEIDGSITAVTSEDFIKDNFIIKQIKLYIENNMIKDEENKKDNKLNGARLVDNYTINDVLHNRYGSCNIKKIKGWFERNLDMDNPAKTAYEITKTIKTEIFNNLTYNDIIIEEYSKLYNGIVKKLGLSKK